MNIGNLALYVYLSSSISQVLFDFVVLSSGYRYPTTFQETPEQLKKRERYRIITAIAFPVASVIGFILGSKWTKLLLSINNMWLFAIIVIIHLLSMFVASFGYITNVLQIVRYYRTGHSRFNSGIMDELAEDTYEGVLDYARITTLVIGTVVSIPFYLLSYVIYNSSLNPNK